MRRAILAFVCLIAALGGVQAVHSQPTDSPAARQLLAWLAAYDGANWDAYSEFLKKNFVSPPGRGFQDPAFRDRTGGFDLKKIEEETPTTATALVQERASDNFARLTLEVEAAEPHRILKITMPLVERPPEFALPPMSDSDLIAALGKRLREEEAAGTFAGAVLLAKNGKPIFAQAYGPADREHNIPNTLKTRFSIASMNKMFTAVATMQLVQGGRLRLDDPLEKYLPDYPNKELAAKVTIGELLSNTGGTGDIWGPEFDKHRLELRTPQDYINLYGNRPLRFETGTRWEYSNYGFILLGAVIERISGESYGDYVREHVYDPAGMTSTSTEEQEGAVGDRSVAYTKMATGEWHPALSVLNRGTSAGGGYSTVGDLLNFANALRQHTLLGAHYTELMTTGKIKAPFGLDAYGFGVQNFNGHQCFGHNGGGPGANGDLEMCMDSSYVVVVLANIDPAAAEQLSQFIIDRLPAAKSGSERQPQRTLPSM